MMVFVVLFFGFIVLFDISTRKYLNPYKLTMIFGKKGSGKTTLLTKLAIQHIKKGWTVYSTIYIPGTILFDVQKIGFLTFPERSCILIDEVGMIWDNRDFKKFKPEVRDYFKFQRQYKNKVYLFSQSFDIDLKLRNLTDEMYLLTNFLRVFSLQRRIIKTIGISNGSENASGSSQLIDEYRFDSILFGGVKFTFIPRYVPYFTSFSPKPLESIQGQYIPLSDTQKRHLRAYLWVYDTFISYILKKAYNLKNKAKKIRRMKLRKFWKFKK